MTESIEGILKSVEAPWRIAEIDPETATCTIESVKRGTDVPEKGYFIARCYIGSPEEPGEIPRLIAAAPDLLEALVKCQEFLGGPWTAPESVIERCRAAIAKATT